MLQKIRDTTGPWIFGFVIALIAVAFVFWGVDLNLTGSNFAARVNGEEISLTEFENEFRNEMVEYQEIYRIDLDAELRREIRRNVLDRMIATRALQQRMADTGYRVSDERLARHIRATSAFQMDGQFSMDIYRAQLRFQGLSPAMYEEVQRSQLGLLDLRSGIVDSTFLTPAEFRRYIELYAQEREVGYAVFEAAAFIDRVEITDEEIVQYYEQNRSAYRSEESVDFEYIELRREDLEPEVEVTEEAVRDYYERQRGRFARDEERRARHILVTVDSGDEDAARAQAADIQARIEAGEDFETLARELSDDTGTRAQGGDLGWLTQGLLDDDLENALYAMDIGEVRGPVRSTFGYHVIRLDDVRAGDVQSFEALEEELREEYVADRLEALFVGRANELADRAFDAYDDLASVAAQMDLPLQTTERFPRSGDPERFPNSAAVVRAAFGREQLEDRLNSSLIELSQRHVLVLRVLDHHPPVELPLEAVRERIDDELVQRRAEELAQAAASAFRVEVDELVSQADGVPGVPGAADSAGERTGEGDAGDEATSEDDAAEAQTDDGDAPAEAEAAADSDEAAAPYQALAEAHGGRWTASRWLGRGVPGVPTEVLSSAFRLPKPAEGEAVIERVFLASGDQAVVMLSGVRPGRPQAISQAERDQIQRELAEQAAAMELGSYAENVREQARVRVPPDVLEDPNVLF
jgi:peptidyl-prolyl cis-trans isomerase D